MKKILAIIAFFCSVAVFAQNEQQGNLLEEAYKNKSKKQLAYFFEKWNSLLPSITEKELSVLNDTLKNTYKVFTEFYKPTNNETLGGSEWGDTIYKSAKYLIVQNDIRIAFTDKLFYTEKETEDFVIDKINKLSISEEKKRLYLRRKNGKLLPETIEDFGPDNSLFSKNRFVEPIDSIKDFRPIINCGNKKPLYLTVGYEKTLNNFLGNKQLPLGAGGIMNPAKSEGESKLRQEFIEQYIKIWAGHWGGYWQLISYPEGFTILFDNKMEYAKIYYRMVYEGGEALLKNDNGKWTLLSGERTWIE